MRLLTGYTKPILTLAFTPDGSGLYSTAKGQQQVWQWDVEAGAVAQKLTGYTNRYGINVLAVSPSGLLLSGSALTCPRIQKPGQGEPQLLDEEVKCHHPRAALAMSPGGGLIAGACFGERDYNNRLRLWPGAGGPHFAELPVTGRYGDPHVTALAFASETGPLAGAIGREVRLWDLKTNEGLHVVKFSAVITAVAFRPDGQMLAASGGKNLFTWDMRQESEATYKDHSANVSALAYSPDGKYLACADKDGIVIVRDAATHEIVGQKQMDVGALSALAWRPNSSELAVGGEKHVALCDVSEVIGKSGAKPKAQGEPLSLAGHTTHVDALAYSPDGKTLASAEKRLVCLWDLSRGAGQAKQITSFAPEEYPSVTSLSWSPDGRRLAVCGPGQIHDGATGAIVHAFEDHVGHLAVLPDGRLFIVGTLESDTWGVTLSVGDAEGRESLAAATLSEEKGRETNYHHFSATGRGGRDCYVTFHQRKVFRWDTQTSAATRLLTQDSRVEGLRVSPDERQLATWGGNRVVIWTLPEGKKHLELKHPLQASGAAFLPNGRLLTSCYDGLVRVWDLSGGSEMQALDLGMGKLYSLAVSPDHMTFAAGAEKKWRVVLMDVPE